MDRIALDEAREVIDEVAESFHSDPREGQFAYPEGQMISLMTEWLRIKYATGIAYRNFADRTKGPWRDALVKHWYEHAGHERDHQYSIAMKIIAMGSDANVTSIQIPQTPQNPEMFFQALMNLELDAIKLGSEIVEGAGLNVNTRVWAENMVEQDGHHLDDLRRMYGKYVKM